MTKTIKRSFKGRVIVTRKGCSCMADIEEGEGFYLNICQAHQGREGGYRPNPFDGDWSVELIFEGSEGK